MPDYPNLQPHHDVKVESDLLYVLCPLVNPDTSAGFVTPWSIHAEPAEVACLFCEWAVGEYPDTPPHGHNPELGDAPE